MNKISVCIPSYNYKRYLSQAIESVLNQTYQNFELIIVDDASTDGSGELIKEYAEKNAKIKYIRNKRNIGMVKNWNKSISLAKGKYISILHADDVYSPSILEIESRILENNLEVGMVFSANYEIDTNGVIIYFNKPFYKNAIFEGEDFVEKIIKRGNFVRFPAVMIRKRCLSEIGLFDESLNLTVDIEMWMRMGSYYKIAYINQPLALYRVHGLNESFKSLSSGKEVSETYRAVKHLFCNANISKSRRERLNYLIENSLENKVLSLSYFYALLKWGGKKAVKKSLEDSFKISEKVKKSWGYLIIKFLLKFNEKYLLRILDIISRAKRFMPMIKLYFSMRMRMRKKSK